MEVYKNVGKDSGISKYEIGNDFVLVEFKGEKKPYTYSYTGRAGKTHVDAMKKLATSGKGLNSYIMKNVKDKFDK